MLSFTGSKCYTLTKSGSTVTAGGTAICDITVNGAGSSCLSGAVNGNGNFTLTTEGVCGFQDTTTVTFAQPSPGIYSASVTFPPGQNMSRCVSCDESTGQLDAPNGIETPTISSPNGTITLEDPLNAPDGITTPSITPSGPNNSLDIPGQVNSQKECSPSQCSSNPDSPSSTPTVIIVRRICFGCGNGRNGHSNNDNDGSSSSDGSDSSLPFLPFFPFLPFLPFFPPFVPFFPIAGAIGDGSGTSGNVPSSGPPGALPSPVPFVTIVINATVPETIGGMYIPYVNFTEDIVYCGVETRGLTVIDESSLPHTLYICEATLNGTYAWVPYCSCSSYNANYGQVYQNTTTVYTDGSTLFLSNSSQFWNEGDAYLGGDTVIRNLTITESFQACGFTLKADSIGSCSGGPTDFPNGITINGVPFDPNNATFTNGSSVTISSSSELIIEGKLDACSATNVSFAMLRGCGGAAIAFPDGITIGGVAVTAGPHTTVLGTTNEVDVAYNAGTNTRTVGLPSEFGPTFTKFSVRTTDLMAITMNDPFTLGAPLFAISDTSVLKYLFVYNRTAATVESNFEYVTPKLSATEVVANNATICPSGSDVTRIKTLGGCGGFPVSMPDGVSIDAPSTVNAAMSINAPLTITDASTFSVTGFTAPLFTTASVTGLYYVPTVYPSLAFCSFYTPMSLSIGLVFNRIGNTKFVFWDWSASFNMPAEITLASSNGCGGATLSTTANSLSTYNLPAAYRPTATYSFTVVSTGSGGAVRSTAFAAYVNSAGYFGIVSDNGGTSDLPTGSSSFYMPTLSYV